MRIKHAIFFGSVTALTMLAAPSLANNSESRKATNDQTMSTPTACHSYQQEADGSWKQLPCRELGSGGESRHKPSPQDGDEH